MDGQHSESSLVVGIPQDAHQDFGDFRVLEMLARAVNCPPPGFERRLCSLAIFHQQLPGLVRTLITPTNSRTR